MRIIKAIAISFTLCATVTMALSADVFAQEIQEYDSDLADPVTLDDSADDNSSTEEITSSQDRDCTRPPIRIPPRKAGGYVEGTWQYEVVTGAFGGCLL